MTKIYKNKSKKIMKYLLKYQGMSKLNKMIIKIILKLIINQDINLQLINSNNNIKIMI